MSKSQKQSQYTPNAPSSMKQGASQLTPQKVADSPQSVSPTLNPKTASASSKAQSPTDSSPVKEIISTHINLWEAFMDRLRKNFNDPTNNEDFTLFSKPSVPSVSKADEDLKNFLTRETSNEDEEFEELGSSSILWKVMKKMWELNKYLMKSMPIGSYSSQRPTSNTVEEQLIHDILFKPWEEYKRLKDGVKEIYWTKFRDLTSLKLGKQITPLYTKKKTKKSTQPTQPTANPAIITSNAQQQTWLPIVVKDSAPTQNQFYLTSASEPVASWHTDLGKSLSHVSLFSPKASLIHALIQLKWVLLKEKALAIIKIKTETIPTLVKLKIKLIKKIIWLLTHKTDYFPFKLFKILAHAKWKKTQTFVNKILKLNEHIKSWKGFGWAWEEETTPPPIVNDSYGWKSGTASESIIQNTQHGGNDENQSVFSSILNSLDISSADKPSSYQNQPSSYQNQPSSYQNQPSSYQNQPVANNHEQYQAPQSNQGSVSSTPYSFLTTPTAQTHSQNGNQGYGDFSSAVSSHQYRHSSTPSPSPGPNHVEVNPQLVQLAQHHSRETGGGGHFKSKKVPVLIYGQQHKRTTDQNQAGSEPNFRVTLPNKESKESQSREKSLFRHKLLETALKGIEEDE